MGSRFRVLRTALHVIQFFYETNLFNAATLIELEYLDTDNFPYNI